MREASRKILPLIVFVTMGVLVSLFAAAPAALAQNARLNLSSLDNLAAKATKVTNVNLDSNSLQLAAGHVSQKQGQMLKHLKGVYVRDFEFAKPGEYSQRDVEAVLKQLHNSGWTNIVTSENKKTGEITNVCVMNEGGETVGLAVVSAQPKQLTVVNLVGPIDLSHLGNMGGNFGIPPGVLQHRNGSPARAGKSGGKVD